MTQSISQLAVCTLALAIIRSFCLKMLQNDPVTTWKCTAVLVLSIKIRHQRILTTSTNSAS